MSDGGGSGMRRGIDALKEFQGKINDALEEFERGHGGPSKIAQHSLDRSSFGGSHAKFGEADDLHKAYGTVHERLHNLSRTLGLHIQALQLATQSADATYDGTEEEVWRRFWQIRGQIDAEYQQAVKEAGTAHKPGSGHNDKPVTPPPARSSNKTMGTGLS
ncbi:hypothetical protein [Streptomyces sp. CoH27]|uniref:hypothetical protein n=1 Tax=Streptomyces sp. CoH27 TaxID=2875763 RepID=UPI001CD59FB8|nr:hypothetical protein [Streptomyces sp. CoH27]